MRAWVCGLVAVSMVAGQAQAASQCARPAEKTAFQVAGLKSQLMVTALSCAAQDKYNAFVVRFRPNLVAQDRALSGYFGRAFGRRAQQQHDDYVTSLANQQSMDGTRMGNAFCHQSVGMFDEVMALSKPTDLPGYASGKSLAQPIAVVDCPVTVTRTRSHSTSRRRTLHS